MVKPLDLVGQRFGRLVVTGCAGSRKKARFWLCACDCGQSSEVRTGSLVNGHTQSCGCFHREQLREASAEANRTHGMHAAPEYQSWNAMKNRCLNANRSNY